MLEGLPSWNVVSWNGLIAGYAQEVQVAQAYALMANIYTLAGMGACRKWAMKLDKSDAPTYVLMASIYALASMG